MIEYKGGYKRIQRRIYNEYKGGYNRIQGRYNRIHGGYIIGYNWGIY